MICRRLPTDNCSKIVDNSKCYFHGNRRLLSLLNLHSSISFALSICWNRVRSWLKYTLLKHCDFDKATDFLSKSILSILSFNLMRIGRTPLLLDRPIRWWLTIAGAMSISSKTSLSRIRSRQIFFLRLNHQLLQVFLEQLRSARSSCDVPFRQWHRWC